MAPKGYNRYMLQTGAGTHPKFAALTDSERCAHFLGVLAVAAMSPIRGCLLVGNLPAQAVHVARAAGVPERVAKSAMRKLEEVGVLARDDERGCFVVHDWNDINPDPGSSTGRVRALRKRQRNGDVTPNETRNGTPNETESVPKAFRTPLPEVEVEVKPSSATPQKENTNAELHSAVVECFAYWQERCDHQQAALSRDRKAKLETRLRERAQLGGGILRAIRDVRQAIDGAARAPFVNDAGKRFDDLELICRTGSKLEDFMDRASAGQPPATGSGRVVPFRRGESTSEIWQALKGGEAS